MDFLKDVLGEELFGQVAKVVKEHNEKPENKEKQVNIVNLAAGEYVGKGKYDTLSAEKTNLETQIKTLNTTIGELKMLMSGYLNCEDIIDPIVPFEESAEGKYQDFEELCFKGTAF